MTTDLMAAAAVLAASIGAPLPVERAAVLVPTPTAMTAPTVPGSAPISAYGYVTGQAYLFCSEPPTGGSGTMTGQANLTGNIPVTGPDGATGTIAVSGFAFLSGSCQHGMGMVSGITTVRGSGALYGRDGKRAGTAHLSGTVFISQFATSSYVWFNERVSLNGRFDAD